jgi:hypothetical protein
MMSEPDESGSNSSRDLVLSMLLLGAALAVAVALFTCSGPSMSGGASGGSVRSSAASNSPSAQSTASPIASASPSALPSAAPSSQAATEPPPAATSPSKRKDLVIAFQPSHQADTSDDPSWKEYVICGDIVDRAIARLPEYTCVKAWDTKHGLTGSNNYRPSPTNTRAFDKELAISNTADADVFVAVHVDSGALSHWLLGEVLPGDARGRRLCSGLLGSLGGELGWKEREPRQVRLYSLEPTRNRAKYRCLLEIGDNEKDRTFLEKPKNRDRIAEAIADGIRDFDASR